MKFSLFVSVMQCVIWTKYIIVYLFQEDSTYRVIKDINGRNIFYCLASECNGLRRSKCRTFNKHRDEVHTWGPITLHVGAPRGCNYKLRSQSKLEKDRKRKNYNIHYRYNKNRSAFETTAIRKEVQKAVKYFLLIFIFENIH